MMTQILPLSALILMVVVLYFGLVIMANRRLRPAEGPLEIAAPALTPPDAGPTLSVLTWNIGYAGLGKNADHFVDDGRSLRALPLAEIQAATKEIATRLAHGHHDVICLQETAEAGFLTRHVPVRHLIEAASDSWQSAFWTDMRTALVPPPLRLAHGMSVLSRVRMTFCEARPLPQDEIYHLGVLKKHYGAVVSRHPIAGRSHQWVVFNIHLSAFDAKGRVRKEQLAELLALAQNEYAHGHHVVIAGDWNMRLTPTDFPHDVTPRSLSWSTDFPTGMLPPGWHIAVDPTRPTVRTLDRPYRPGRNYTTIIDGFVTSPNVTTRDVATHDLGFGPTDHQPVTATFLAVSAP